MRVDADPWEVFSGAEEARLGRRADGRVLHSARTASHVAEPSVSQVLFAKGFRPHYPMGRSFAVCVSHDVDNLLRPHMSFYERTRLATKELLSLRLRRAWQYQGGKHPINPDYNIDMLLEIERKLNVVSTFYFLSLSAGDRDFNYELDNVPEVIRQVVDAGCEIGLHGGHEAFRDTSRMRKEKLRLESHIANSISGYRNHFLKFDVPDTWLLLEKNGFSYDSTYGFPDMPAFRNGMCYPFFPFLENEQRYCDVLEIPLLIMDATFIYYLNYDERKAFTAAKAVIDKTRAVNGVVTLLWHNNYLFSPWRKLFESILRYCRDSDAWFATGDQINRWWRQNDFCSSYPEFGLYPKT